jgi:type I restriction enzyme, R subunit
MVYFQPNSGLNLEHRELYLKNRFSLIRQLKYSLKNENSIDLALFLNTSPLHNTFLLAFCNPKKA